MLKTGFSLGRALPWSPRGAGGTAPDDAILTMGGSWIVTAGGDHITQTVVVNPTVDASQTFSLAEDDADGVFGTVATTGATPDGFVINTPPTNIDIQADGDLEKTGAVTPGTYTPTVSATLGAYTSPAVAIEIEITAAPAGPLYAPESGDQVVIGASAWGSGQSVTAGDWRSNGGRLYEATTSGTTGATAPTHTSGDASDGTVTWAWCCDVGYTSMSSWVSSLAATLTAPRTAIIWAKAEVSSSSAAISISSITTSSTNKIVIKAKDELMWCENASPIMGYNASKGVAFSCTGAYSVALNLSNVADIELYGLQFKGIRAAAEIVTAGTGTTNMVLSRCLFWFTGDAAMQIRGTMKNCVVIRDHAGTSASAVNGFGAGTMVNCTIVRPSNRTAGGRAFSASYGAWRIQNTIAAGFTTAPSGTFTGSSHNSATDTTCLPSAASNVTISAMSTEFVEPSSAAAEDYRLLSGASSRSGGTTNPSGGDLTDVFGLTRTASWDIGAHEYA